MISVSIDENEEREMAHEEIKRVLREVDNDFVFWDSKELKRRTCMSWEIIQSTFFFDPRFPKRWEMVLPRKRNKRIFD